ncbi:MAG: flagellar assembly protein FliW [Erysipelotrichaceae bacterium]
MNIQTKYFGLVEIQESTILTFVKPIYGFEHCHTFTILSDIDLGSDLVWLQSIEHSEVCFLLGNAQAFIPDYTIELSLPQLQQVQATKLEDVDILNIVVMGTTFQQSTMNLKSPIVVNPSNNQAMQVIVEQDYDFKQRMFASC